MDAAAEGSDAGDALSLFIPVNDAVANGWSMIPVAIRGGASQAPPGTELTFSLSRAGAGLLRPRVLTAGGAEPQLYFTPCDGVATPACLGPVTIRVLDLETLIGVKAATGRARDKLVLPDTDGWNACHRFDGFQPRRKRAVDDRVGMHQGRRAPNIFCLSGAMLSARRSTVLKMDRPMWSSDTASSPIWRDRRTASKL